MRIENKQQFDTIVERALKGGGTITIGNFEIGSGPVEISKQQDALDIMYAEFEKTGSISVKDSQFEDANGGHEFSVVEAPVVEAPIVEAQIVEAQIAEAPVAEAPVVEAPVLEAPIAEAPIAEAPVVEAPIVEAQIVEAIGAEQVAEVKEEVAEQVAEQVKEAVAEQVAEVKEEVAEQVLVNDLQETKISQLEADVAELKKSKK
jgi:hypothetical protein